MAPKFKAARHLLKLAEKGKTWARADLEQLQEEDSAKLWRRSDSD